MTFYKYLCEEQEYYIDLYEYELCPISFPDVFWATKKRYMNNDPKFEEYLKEGMKDKEYGVSELFKEIYLEYVKYDKQDS